MSGTTFQVILTVCYFAAIIVAVVSANRLLGKQKKREES